MKSEIKQGEKGCVYLLRQQEKKLDRINQHRESEYNFFLMSLWMFTIKRGCIEASKREKLTPARQNRFYGRRENQKTKNIYLKKICKGIKIVRKNISTWRLLFQGNLSNIEKGKEGKINVIKKILPNLIERTFNFNSMALTAFYYQPFTENCIGMS